MLHLFLTLKKGGQRSIHVLLLHYYQMLRGGRRSWISWVFIINIIIAFASHHNDAIVSTSMALRKISSSATHTDNCAPHQGWRSSLFKDLFIDYAIWVSRSIRTLRHIRSSYVHECQHSSTVFLRILGYVNLMNLRLGYFVFTKSILHKVNALWVLLLQLFR